MSAAVHTLGVLGLLIVPALMIAAHARSGRRRYPAGSLSNGARLDRASPVARPGLDLTLPEAAVRRASDPAHGSDRGWRPLTDVPVGPVREFRPVSGSGDAMVVRFPDGGAA